MRFWVKVVLLGVLGCAAALLVACGDRNGLLSGSQAASLRDALDVARSACDDGDPARAQVAARSFADRVEALSDGNVDRRIVRNLREGAATLEALVPQTCTGASETTTTPTVTTTTTPTTTTAPATTETTPTVPTTPTETTPPATEPPPSTTPVPPEDGSDDPEPGNSGGAPGQSGEVPPGLAKKGFDGE